MIYVKLGSTKTLLVLVWNQVFTTASDKNTSRKRTTSTGCCQGEEQDEEYISVFSPYTLSSRQCIYSRWINEVRHVIMLNVWVKTHKPRLELRDTPDIYASDIDSPARQPAGPGGVLCQRGRDRRHTVQACRMQLMEEEKKNLFIAAR